MRRHAWVILVVAAGLLVTRAVEFAPPPEVRHRSDGGIVGDSPPQAFRDELGSAQAVQLRTTLRLYPDPALDVREPDPELDAQARVLSQPVVTTILGLSATVEQTVRLEGDALEIDISVQATPRRLDATGGADAARLSLETEVRAESRRSRWFGEPRRRIHVDSHATLIGVDERSHRLVFSVDDHLFALDLELHRPYG